MEGVVLASEESRVQERSKDLIADLSPAGTRKSLEEPKAVDLTIDPQANQYVKTVGSRAA